MRRLLPALAALALLVGGLAALRARSVLQDAPPGDARSTGDSTRTSVAAPVEGGVAPDADRVAQGAAVGPRPRSLRGTRVDGELTVVDGRFVVTEATRRFFDYFLSASGEESPEAIRARIVAAIAERLPPGAARDAEALLDRYLRYRERARDLAQTTVAGDLEERFTAIVAIRREIFGADDAAALFADEEAAVRAAIAERAIREDLALPAEERARRLAALEAERPEGERAARAAALQAVDLRREEAALRDRGGSAEDLRELRERTVGPEATARLEALDRSRAAWQERVAAFRAERAAIEADSSLSDGERDAAIKRLLDERFSAPERLRVRALDEIANAGNPGGGANASSGSGSRMP